MKHQLLFLGFGILSVLGAVGPAWAQDTGTWFTRAPLPTPRQEVSHAVLEGRIYVPGGFVAGGTATNVVEAYDPAGQSWAAVPPLPLAVHHTAVAVVSGRFYVLGGYAGNSFTPTARVFEFDPIAPAWNEKASMPGARGAATAAALGGMIYVIGGVVTGGGVVGTNQRYDPSNNTWSTLAPMPTPREHLASAVIDSLIYVVGGRDFSAGGNTGALEAYSPATNTWYVRPAMPTARGGLAAAALHGRLYAFGGEIPGVYDEVEEFDPASGSWSTMTPMQVPRHGIGAAAIGDTIFVIGGATVQGFGVSDVNSGFTLPPPAAVGDETTPRAVRLLQNHPNPVRTITRIGFELPVAGDVELEVFDLAGRRIATLVHQPFEAGRHVAEWAPSGLSPGLYFYRLSAPGWAATRKLVVER